MGHCAGMNDSPHGLGLARWPPQQFGMPGNTHMNQTNALDAGNMKALVVRQALSFSGPTNCTTSKPTTIAFTSEPCSFAE